MINFNHERLALAMQTMRMARCCYEESMKYAHKVIPTPSPTPPKLIFFREKLSEKN